MRRYSYMDDWRQHPIYRDILVSDSGVVFSYLRGFWYELKQSDNGSGYLRVGVGHSNPQYVHRLVAETFVLNPYPDILIEVDHKDGDKHNNFANNLEWVTPSDNDKRAYDLGLKDPGGRHIRIVETGDVYPSIAACARSIGGIRGNISRCLAGGRRTHRGYSFEYWDGEEG